MAKSEKEAVWEKYKSYVLQRDTRKKPADSSPVPSVSSPAPSASSPAPADSGTEEDDELIAVPAEAAEITEENPADEAPVTADQSAEEQVPEDSHEEETDEEQDVPAEDSEKEQAVKENFFTKNSKILVPVSAIVLILADAADMLGISVLSGTYSPALSGKIFKAAKFDSINPAVWKPDLFRNVLTGAVAFVIAGFIAFLLHNVVCRLIKSFKKKRLYLTISYVLPFVFCLAALIYCLAAGFTPFGIGVLFAMAGGLFYFLLDKISLEIPVDSVKTDGKKKKVKEKAPDKEEPDA